MRRFTNTFAASLTLACMLALGCESPFGPDGDTTEATLAKGTTTKSESVEQLNKKIFVSCANGGVGEKILLIGEVRVRTQTTVSESGNVLVKSVMQIVAEGTGEISGDTYRGKGKEQSTLSIQADDFPVSISRNNIMKLVSSDPGNNLRLHTNVQVTLNNNGEITSTVSNVTVECK